MFTIANIATLRGQVTADGVICLMALYIEDTMSEDALASLCERSLKHMRTVVFPKLHLHHYAETVSVFIKITSKARDILTQIGSAFATSFGLQAAAHSADAATPIDAQAPLPLSIAPVENFSTPLSLSDHDQITTLKSDLDQIERNTAQTPRDIQAIAALLDRHHVYEPKRSKLLADRWVTVQRIQAALYRSQHNAKRKSANPVPLAISELLDPRYRPAIDATAAQLAAGQPPATPSPVGEGRGEGEPTSFPNVSIGNPADDPDPLEARRQQLDAERTAYENRTPAQKRRDQIWQAAMGELQLQMTRATYDTWVKPTAAVDYANGIITVAVPTDYAREWWTTRLLTTVNRILTGITGQPTTAQFITHHRTTP